MTSKLKVSLQSKKDRDSSPSGSHRDQSSGRSGLLDGVGSKNKNGDGFEKIEELIESRKAAEATGSELSYFQVFDQLF